MSEAGYGPVIAGCITIMFGWFLVQGFRTGTMEWGYFGLRFSGDRKSEPGKFWAATVLLGLAFIAGLRGTMFMVVWPNGIGG